MADNSQELLGKLYKLTPREKQVLECRCRGWGYGTIAKTLVIGEKSVKTYMDRIYNKLELKGYGRAARMKLLYEEYCPLVQQMEKTSRELVLVGGKQATDQEDREAEKAVIPPEDEKILDEDEYAIVLVQPAPLRAPDKTPGPGPRGIRGLAIGVALGILVGAGAVYLILGGSKGPHPFVPPPTATVLPPTPLPSATALPSRTEAVAPTQAPTSVPPTDTAIPTATIPSPTAVFVPPADGILFQDNFDNGLKPEWTQYSGQWIVSDGKLTEVYQQTSTDAYSWIGVENPSWKNYIVDVTIQIYQPLTESDEIALAVRDNTVGSKYIGFEIDFWPHIYLSMISQGYSSSAPIAGNNKDFTFPLKADGLAEIKVQDNNYTLSVNGSTLQTLNISGYDSGGFRLGLYCRGYPQCPTFDNVKVTYLP